MSGFITLNKLPVGKTAQILHLMGSKEELRRLQKLGLRQGQIVEMIRPSAPCTVHVGGKEITMSHCDALNVVLKRPSSA